MANVKSAQIEKKNLKIMTAVNIRQNRKKSLKKWQMSKVHKFRKKT